MKTKNIIVCVLLSLAAQVVTAQNSAETLVRGLVGQLKKHNNVEMAYHYQINAEGATSEAQPGKAWLQGEAYKVEMVEQQVISDGKTIWSYLVDDEEVMVSDATEGTDNTPLKLLTSLDENFVATLAGVDSKGITTIELANPKGQYRRVTLKANANKMEIKSMDIYMEDGTKLIITVDEMKYDQKLGDKFLIVPALFTIPIAFCWKQFEAAGQKGWYSLIPYYNIYVLLKIIGKHKKFWWWFFIVFPYINIFMLLLMLVELGKCFGRFKIWEEGMAAILPCIFFPIIAKDDKYQDPLTTQRPKKSTAREWFDAIIFAVVAALIIRTYVFEAFTIPTSSMEKSLCVGDYLIVSKIHYGPKALPMNRAISLALSRKVGLSATIASV